MLLSIFGKWLSAQRLFYHPAVWWLSHRVNTEREMCCDEMALAATGGRVVYAEALNSAARLVIRSPQPTLAASFLGEKKMDLLNRVRNILGSGSTGDNGRWWPVAVAAVVLPLAIWCVLATLPSDRGTAVLADEREGQREQRGDREREAGEGARERGESPEARHHREGDREREGSPGDRFRAAERPQSEFRPQTEREAALYRMVQQLQRELMQLRREVGQMRGGPMRDGPPPRDMAPPRRDPVGSRDPHPPRGEVDRERAQQINIFNRYDRTSDKKITLDEFLAMREGTDKPEVRAQWERVFVQGDRNRDRTWSLEEFLAAAQRRREGGGDRPREGDRPRPDAPRDGDRTRPDAPRDGDRPRTDAPRDGDRPRTDAPRDGDRPRGDAPRDGDRPRPDAPRDGDRPRPDVPRDGDRAPRDGDRDR